MSPDSPARPVPWPARRLFPLLATIIMAAAGIAGTIWGPRFYGKTAWALPDDLWGTLIAAQRLAHLNLTGLYTLPTQLVSLPGTAVILVPAIAVIEVTGLHLGLPSAHGAYPAVWLFAGPYQVAISGVALFAADAIAERLGATRPRRFWLAAAGATALWSVTVRWGHPEDAVAVGLLLYAVLDLSSGKTSRSAWLIGAAVAVQPLVLLAFPLLAAVVEPRRLAGYVARAATPAAVLLAAAAAANWTATIHAVTSQPNSPAIDHPTPWIYLAPHLAGAQVAAGPARIVSIVAACACALVVARRWRATRPPVPWDHDTLAGLLWWVALTLALRSAFEPVMVAYYLWPPLAVALAAAARDWRRLLPVGVVAVVLTFFSQVQWHDPWAWWTPMVAGLGLALYFARVRPRRGLPGASPPPQVLPEPGEQFAADGAP
ncbi:MAG TPA: hypothetical protein VGI96_26220 [Streptosporangiaceae bacterium]